MNAPTKIQTADVHSYLPDAQGEELELRTKLLVARDHAAALWARAVDQDAAQLARKAHDLAGAVVYRSSLSVPVLQMAVEYCRSVVKAAMLSESITAAVGE